ncbi:hypothetical protein QTJ16_000809 [Diplocarpon rosae]|uniref:alpha-galactosidase n=1 Tax=Diplocarpon rosae TaxID=946125 RepID=A0AAD9WHV2_9HELO|nr:hypothetical protein QTJ16_000809 [Diplocarpon rosae]
MSFAKRAFLVGAVVAQLSASAALDAHYFRYHALRGAWAPSQLSALASAVPTTTGSYTVPTEEASLPTYSETSGSDADADPTDEACDKDDDAAADDNDDDDDDDDKNTEATTVSGEGSDSEPDATSSSIPPEVPVSATVAPTPVATYAPASSPAAAAYPASTPASGDLWQPPVGASWQIELTGVVTDTTYEADVWELDLYSVPQATIEALHAAGRKVICYFSAGSFEDWRDDADQFTDADKGSPYEGWEGEWWLDTRSANVRSIMAARIDFAKSKGCDALDPDNVDVFTNDNGVGLTEADGMDYITFLTDKAHSIGLSVGLKNSAELVPSVVDMMQFHINEQCIEYAECDLFAPFIGAGKPVFHIEYPPSAPAVDSQVKTEKCAAATSSGFSTILKSTNLDSWIDPC